MSDWDESKTKVLARLKRGQGQLRAVIEMAEREEDCERVAQQLSAVRKALDRAFYDMVACAMRRELSQQGIASPRDRIKLDHLTELLTRYG